MVGIIDKLKLKICGDIPSIISLQMEIDDLEMDKKELENKLDTYKNNDHSWSKQWEKTFFEDFYSDIQLNKELIGLRNENKELYSQLQELAKLYEESKDNYQSKIFNKNIKLMNLSDWNNTLHWYQSEFKKMYKKNLSNEKEIENLSKQLNKLELEYELLLQKYQNEENIEEVSCETDIEISTLKEENNRLISLISKKNSEINELQNLKLASSDSSTLSKKDNHKIKRDDKEYRRFKEYVLKRDNSTCQVCGSKLNPHVHHQYSFAKYNHLGATVSNGIVLCEECHKKYHSKEYAGVFGDPYSFAIFMRENGKLFQSHLEVNIDERCALDEIGGK